MSLLGSIVEYYQTTTDAPTVALRDSLGSDFFADTMPEIIDDSGNLIQSAFPYCVLVQGNRTINTQVKANPGLSWIESVPVVFGVYGTSRNQVEGIIDQLELAFLPIDSLPTTLTISNRLHMATYPGPSDLGIVEDSNGDIWQGTLSLTFELQRGGY